MLDILVSYHCMQFQGKLMKQTWENSKKAKFGPPNFFFSEIWLRQSLDIMVSYHHAQSSGPILEKTNDPILRKLSDGRTDGQTDKQTRASKKEVLHLNKYNIFSL